VFRKDLIDLLLNRPLSLRDIAVVLDVSPRDVEDDLRHLIKSLKASPYREDITPARCRKCGFQFRADKLHKPGKCPRCRDGWISDPLIGISRRKEG